ncbi:MAG: protein translocase subunit SecF [Clostridia bacterium]|nr:protein translocase subunit SecF [Clostridia bacterium]
MKRTGKPVVFIVLVLILCFAFASFFGVFNYYGDIKTSYFKGAEDIRWGIDISGGVEAVFTPDIKNVEITDADMDSAKEIISTRLLYNNITDSEIYVDYNNKQVIVRFPWKADEEDFDPAAAVEELGEMAVLTFRAGNGDAEGKIILQGNKDIAGAQVGYEEQTGYIVSLELTADGKTKFATGTKENLNGYISIYMDDELIRAPKVESVITDGNAMITGMSSYEDAEDLANKINAGSLPFALTVDDAQLNVVSPTYGESALNTMLVAGIIAFAVICLILIAIYRLPGFVSSICLLGQVAGIIACISGFFPSLSSFTLTVPGIAGIILSIGMGVDANVVTNERIKEELSKGKTVEGAVKIGYKNAWSAILDGNVTNIIVALVLMAAFGSPDSFLSKIFTFIFPFLSSSITGAIYSFGVTLLIGAVWNFVMGIAASRLMMTSLTSFKFFRNPAFYGYAKEPKKIEFTKFFKKSLIIVTAFVLVGVVFFAMFGANLDINYTGGYLSNYSYTGDIDVSAVEKEVANTVKYNVTVNKSGSVSGDKTYINISIASKNGITAEQQEAVTKALTEKFKDNNIALENVQNVSASIGVRFFIKTLFAVLLAAALVVVYVALRFKNIGGASAAVTALIALLHDVVITFLFCCVFKIKIDANFMAVVLTLLGYSLNNTIVIYDRVRENRRKLSMDISREEIVNKSISETFTRSILTTVTTLIAVVSIAVISELRGVTSLRSFAIPMAVGLISGCFSSVFLAGPLWVKWRAWADAKKAAKAPAKKKYSKKKKR